MPVATTPVPVTGGCVYTGEEPPAGGDDVFGTPPAIPPELLDTPDVQSARHSCGDFPAPRQLE